MRDSQITKNKDEQVKKANRGKKMKIAISALVAMLVVTMIVINHEKTEARNQELEAYHAEQFEKMKNQEFEEANFPKTQDSSCKIQETNEDVNQKFQTAVMSSMSLEMQPLHEEDFIEEQIEVFEEENPEEAVNTSKIDETPEYKPTKLTGFEISAEGPYGHYVYILSEEDMKYIAKLVWAEARGECYEGKVAVAATVLNRYFSNNPDFNRTSILHIITQPYHFANIWNVTDWAMRNDTECLEAVKDACRGWDPTREIFEEGALYFYNPDGVNGYQAEVRQNIRVMVIGAHAFHYDFEKNVG